MAIVSSMSRLVDLRRFYDALGRAACQQGGRQLLADAMTLPMAGRGVYFFFEPGEHRQETGEGLRVVRVGTHALKSGASSTLRGRLRQHGGSRVGGGNHRGSIFRLLTGDALMLSGRHPRCASWGSTKAAVAALTHPAALKGNELPSEQAVSRHLATTSIVWLGIDDDPGPASLRGWIERNAIALLSNYGKPELDAPSSDWLGRHSSRARVRMSGLWNQNHVDESYDPDFLDDLDRLLVR